MKVTLRFDGGTELAAALNALPARVGARIKREILKDAAEPMRASMAQLAPHDPGPPDLRDSMTISSKHADGQYRADDKLQIVAVGPARSAFYGIFQEYGTVHHGAQPFARPAFDAEAPKALETIRKALWRELAARGVGRRRTSTSGASGGPGGSLL